MHETSVLGRWCLYYELHVVGKEQGPTSENGNHRINVEFEHYWTKVEGALHYAWRGWDTFGKCNREFEFKSTPLQIAVQPIDYWSVRPKSQDGLRSRMERQSRSKSYNKSIWITLSWLLSAKESTIYVWNIIRLVVGDLLGRNLSWWSCDIFPTHGIMLLKTIFLNT